MTTEDDNSMRLDAIPAHVKKSLHGGAGRISSHTRQGSREEYATGRLAVGSEFDFSPPAPRRLSDNW